MSQLLKEKLISKRAKAAVIGLGYIGLPLAVELANAGYEVFGIDISREKIDSLNGGKSYVIDVSDEAIGAIINQNLFVGDDFSVLLGVDAISICVPTPLNKTKDPDVSYITTIVEEIVKYMKRETLVILESTTYPGTTEELIANTLEKRRNFKVGLDFFVCFSAERIDPGNRAYHTKNTPRVIGGLTSKCLELGVIYYRSIIENIVSVSSTKVAEMVKLLENTFRSVNIALVNELTLMSDRMGINIWEVIDAASTKPFGFMPFYPGPGIGGHCIPLDPMYLSWKAKMFNYYNRFIELASDINGNMPRYVLNQISDILNSVGKPIKNGKIFLIGVAYKKNIDDVRESPAIEIYRLLEGKGAEVSYYDPYVPSFKNKDQIVFSKDLTLKNLKNSDLVVLTTDHSNVDYQYIVDNTRIVYDTRNVTKLCTGENIILIGGQKK